jgi:hypothetical protein
LDPEPAVPVAGASSPGGQVTPMVEPFFRWPAEQLQYVGTGLVMVGLATAVFHTVRESTPLPSSPLLWILIAIVFGLGWQRTALVPFTAAVSTVFAVGVPLAVFGRVFLLLVRGDV